MTEQPGSSGDPTQGTDAIAGAPPLSPAWNAEVSAPAPLPDFRVEAGMAAGEQDSMVSGAWRWAMATLFLLPILGFWSLPAAARTGSRLSRGDVPGARRDAATCRKLGIAAIVVVAVVFVFWGVMLIVAVGSSDGTDMNTMP